MTAISYTRLYTCRLVREGSVKTRPKLSSSEKAKAVACELLRDLPNEAMVAIMLDTKYQVIGSMVVTEGILDASLVHPREFFRPAIIRNASAIVAAHNHPSGDLTPSGADIDISDRLAKNGDDEVKSFAEEGILRRR